MAPLPTTIHLSSFRQKLSRGKSEFPEGLAAGICNGTLTLKQAQNDELAYNGLTASPIALQM